MKIFTILAFSLSFVATVLAQQIPDSSFIYSIAQPKYAAGTGPIVCVDAAHQNFHTPDNRFYAFAKLLRADGYLVNAFEEDFSAESLKKCFILVISNPLHEQNASSWQLPNPSAFTNDEIQAVKNWVNDGGRLFLIADHMPFAGAAHDLAQAFGFEFLNCFAMDNRQRSAEYFYRSNKTLQAHEITADIDTIVTFTGSAFKIPRKAKPVLKLNATYTLLSPQVAWQFDDSTPHLPADGFCQLASLEYSKGKVFVSGEAAMFSAQLAGANRTPMGMNAPYAKENPKLLLNIIHWLAKN
ncbi:MAG: DUF4350 domain-containing protein [Saprospiraceae bacterium]|nr:DUF4350 domain-containing protein [Saprospiraceae bacterium]